MAMGSLPVPPKGKGSSEGINLSLTDLNPHFVCVLCFGYFVDATTITECMHTFCKSCIVNFLRTNHHCPHCDTLLSRTRPFNSLRPDSVMQSLVYKTVPGLFQTEMRRRVQFYQSHPHPDFEPDVEGIQNYIFSPEDFVSLSLRYYNFRDCGETPPTTKEDKMESCRRKESFDGADPVDINAVRYFRCPATVPISVLKALVKSKYRIPDFLRVELLYGEERLLDSWTLMEVAYIFQWKRESPMELSFQVLITKKVKRKRLKVVRKKKEPSKSKGGPFGSFPRLRGSDSNSSQEPPLKISRIEETSSLSSADEHHPRPPTPPETPDGPADMNVDSDNQLHFLPNSPKLKCDENFHRSRKHFTKESKIRYRVTDETEDIKTSDEKFESLKAESECVEDQNFYSSDKSIASNKTEDQYENSNSLTEEEEEEDNERGEDDSGDLAGDPDSEAPLEVDTSHETEPELDNDGEGDIEKDENSKFEEVQKMEVDDEEQGDSAIDVNETSVSELMDSDDKDTDFNVSTESIDVDGNGFDREKDCEKSEEKHTENSEDLNQQSGSEENAVELNEKEKDKNDSNGTDDLGVLDLSCHARSVRAQRENSNSPVTPSPSPPTTENDRDSKLQNLHNLLNSQNNSTKRSLKALRNAQSEGSNGSNNFLASSNISQRPPIPMDWVRPPLVGQPHAPHAAAFRDLVTLSHAAVQLQLAMAHAQAQAQQAQAQAHAQAQAQAHKIQAHVQANVLKNLKASETLSFVNGSGDTLTISPIPGNQGNPKPKISSKLSKPKTNNINQNGSSNKNMLSCLHGPSKLGKLNPMLSNKNKDLLLQNKGKSVYNDKLGVNSVSNARTNSYNSHPVKTNSPTINTHNTALPNSNQSINNKPSHGNAKAPLSKPSSTSLKIPNVHLNSKNNTNKVEKDRKEVDKDKERTGDPVFKITNQKLIEFVRQQHLNNKLKQNNNNTTSSNNNNNNSNSTTTSKVNLNSSESLTLKISANNSTLTSGVTPKPISKPTLAVVPTASNINNKVNNSVTKINTVNTVSGAPKTSTCPITTNSITTTSLKPLPTIISPNGTKPLSSSPLEKNETSLQNGKPSNSLTPKSLSISSSSPSTTTVRTTNTHVRQIPNPSRLHQQSENRISAGMGRITTSLLKKGIGSGGSQTEGLSRIESLTRSLHEKVAASHGVKAGVLNSLAR